MWTLLYKILAVYLQPFVWCKHKSVSLLSRLRWFGHVEWKDNAGCIKDRSTVEVDGIMQKVHTRKTRSDVFRTIWVVCDVLNIWFWSARYPAIFQHQITDLAKMLKAPDILLLVLFCSLVSVVICNAAGRMHGRSGGRHSTAGQSYYVPLGW